MATQGRCTRSHGVAEGVEVREMRDMAIQMNACCRPTPATASFGASASVARYEERDGDVYLELDAMALTGDIPASLAWIINPVVNRLSINSMTATLRQRRDGVISLRDSSETSSCPTRARGSVTAKAGGE